LTQNNALNTVRNFITALVEAEVKTTNGLVSTASKTSGSIAANVYIAGFESQLNNGYLSPNEMAVVTNAIREMKAIQKNTQPNAC
jgi:hypothetical protein